jgi:hypothetical protein
MQYTTKVVDFVQGLIEHLQYMVCIWKEMNHLSICVELNFFYNT